MPIDTVLQSTLATIESEAMVTNRLLERLQKCPLVYCKQINQLIDNEWFK